MAQSLATKDLLTTLLTTEGLLFAAISIAVGFTASSSFGPRTIVAPAAIALGSTIVLILVAVAAVVAWASLFGGGHWPASFSDCLGALALLLAIVAQPVISLVVSLGVWRG